MKDYRISKHREKQRRKQALIEMMRKDEEDGLYSMKGNNNWTYQMNVYPIDCK